MTPPPLPSEARLVGERYEIVRPLASGGMATVYVARHHLTRQEVALKVIASAFARDEAGVGRFLREVSVASRINHPGVVRVFDAGFDTVLGSPYLAMELLEGCSLAQLFASRRIHQHQAMRYVLAMLEPLAAAHDAGVVHRDLKPENVFVAQTPGGEVVKLLDFGVARDLRGSRSATLEGTALGTVYYMAPEQALDARAVTASADVYALGVILYQVLCGIFPFDGTTPHAIIIRANRELAVPTAERVPGIDPLLAELVDRCLAKDPNERPADAATLRDLLAPMLAQPAVNDWLAERPVNPATFLSTPPPRPSPSLVFDDPFAEVPPPPRPPLPTAEREALTLPPPEPRSPEVPAEVSEPPRRFLPRWALAALAPIALLAALLAASGRSPARAPTTPPTSVPTPRPTLPAVAVTAPPPRIAPAPSALPPVLPPTPTSLPAAGPRGRTRSVSNDLRASPGATASPSVQPSGLQVPPAPPPPAVVSPPAPTVTPSPTVTTAPSPVVAAPVVAPSPPPEAAPRPSPPTPAAPSHDPPPFVSF